MEHEGDVFHSDTRIGYTAIAFSKVGHIFAYSRNLSHNFMSGNQLSDA